MTIEEALEKAREFEACWIVWNADTGEILSVAGVDSDASPADRLRHLQGLSGFGVPVKTRYFESSDVTRQVLERERADTDRVKTRISVLNAWSRAPVQDLVQLLERGEYQLP